MKISRQQVSSPSRLSPAEWHTRYKVQARWTAAVRQYLFEQLHLSETARLLEVGCGTGAILSDLNSGYASDQLNPADSGYANNQPAQPADTGYANDQRSSSADSGYANYPTAPYNDLGYANDQPISPADSVYANKQPAQPVNSGYANRPTAPHSDPGYAKPTVTSPAGPDGIDHDLSPSTRFGYTNDMSAQPVNSGYANNQPAQPARHGYTQHAALYGLDISLASLCLCAQNVPTALLVQGDAHALPYASACFEAVFCHFLLLWVAHPVQVVAEMRRVAAPGAAVLALAEPDYAGRIDYPQDLAQLGLWQQASLRDQGADPFIGRKLAAIFHQAGLRDIQTGILGGQWRSDDPVDESEWQMLQHDLIGRVSESELDRLRRLDMHARQKGERILFVPTFYVLGWVD